MSRPNRDACIAFTMAREGGYVDDPDDPGGATNLGITLATLASWRGRPVSKAEVRALGCAEAQAIYAARYWCGDDLPPGLDLVAFDAGVMSGPSRGIRFLQTALGVTADGRLGPETRAAAARADGPTTIARACAARLAWLRGRSTWGKFGDGWSRRTALVEARAQRMWLEAAGLDPAPALKRGTEQAIVAQDRHTTQAIGTLGAGAAGLVLANTTLPGSLLLVVAAIGLVARLPHPARPPRPQAPARPAARARLRVRVEGRLQPERQHPCPDLTRRTPGLSSRSSRSPSSPPARSGSSPSRCSAAC